MINRKVSFKVEGDNYDPETEKRVNHDIDEFAKHGKKDIERHHLIE